MKTIYLCLWMKNKDGFVFIAGLGIHNHSVRSERKYIFDNTVIYTKFPLTSLQYKAEGLQISF